MAEAVAIVAVAQPPRIVSSSETRCSVMTSLDAGSMLALGGMLKLMDQCACMSAETLCLLPCVTAGMDEVVVSSVLGENGGASQHVFVLVESTVNAAWRSSCEVGCIASLEYCTGERRRLCSAYFTFVSTQKLPFPTLVVDAGDVDQARRFSEAQERRRIRLARKVMLEQFVVSHPRRSRAHSSALAVKSGDGSRVENRGHTELLQLVLPGHCNHHGNLFGGWTLEWSVQTALLAATRHARTSCVLLQSDDIMFVRPIFVGDRVLCNARVNRVFVEQNTLEVGVRLIRRSLSGQEEHALSAYFLIAPASRDCAPLPQVTRETEDDKRRYGKANARMALRLERQGLKIQSLDFCPLLDSKNEVSVSSLILANVAGLLRAFDTSRFAESPGRRFTQK
jgi:acyl-CoA hydrolase